MLLPDDKGRSGGGENPAGGARGGWRSEGVVIFDFLGGGFSASMQSLSLFLLVVLSFYLWLLQYLKRGRLT